jgi:hypothetical protein
MPECSSRESNAESCACTYTGCPRKGKCCECLRYHLAHRELPGCCFPSDVERTFDRSFRQFAALHGG